MAEDRHIAITSDLSIPTGELRFQFARSGGPGGQHVNTSATSVELTFDVAGSPSLTEEQRGRILRSLRGYIDGRGLLHLVSTTSRSQHRNREEVVARFQRLLRSALHVAKKRVATAPSRATRERRLEAKRRRTAVKRNRRASWSDE